MSKAFFPPNTMNKADIKAVADVRRAVWTGGLQGVGFGLGVGYGLHKSLPHLGKVLNITPSLKSEETNPARKIFAEMLASQRGIKSSNNAVAFALTFGAVFSYLGATSAGRNNVDLLHSVIEKGRDYSGLTDYANKLRLAKIEGQGKDSERWWDEYEKREDDRQSRDGTKGWVSEEELMVDEKKAES